MCAGREFKLNHPIKGNLRPRGPADPPVEPFKKQQIELRTKARDFCEEAVTDQRREFIMQPSTFERRKAILLT